MILTKKLKRLVRRWGSVMSKCIDALLPCCHLFTFAYTP